MEQTKVTAEILRQMKTGESRIFKLPDSAAIMTGKAIAYYVARRENCKFSAVSDFEGKRLKLTKHPKSWKKI